ncbi:MAG: hypothetical protein HYV35_05390 [Lentisphaerae bacterium]|nr:hypothetical protein [Lentisphaerota bacterium]
MNNPDYLLRHSFMLLAASQVSNLCNVLFQMVMGRWLSLAEYGILASMLGVILISGLPLNALSNAAAFFSAQLQQQQRAGDILSLVRAWTWKLSAVTLALLVSGVALSGFFSNFFKLPDRIPFMVALAVLALSLYPPIIGGALQGIQAFGWGAVSAASMGVVRLLSSAALVGGMAAMAGWALVGQGLGVIVGAAIGLLGLRLVLRRSVGSAEKLPPGRVYLLRTLGVLAFFSFLMNADVLIVKHYFDPDASGLFARAGTIGRAIVFLPMPIAGALFPKTVSAGGMSVQHGRLLRRALLYSALLVIPTALLGTLFPQVPLGLLYHDWRPEAAMANLVRATIWALSPLSLAYVIMHFELAQNRFGLAWPLLLAVAGYLIGVALWHATVLQVVAVLAVVSFLTLIVLVMAIPGKEKSSC